MEALPWPDSEEGTYEEEGSNNMKLSLGPAKKQKWIAKKTHKEDYLFYDFPTDMGADPFLASVSQEEEENWFPDLQKQLEKSKACGGEKWYFVFWGPKCGLYKQYEPFIEARDETMKNGELSKKGTRFNSLQEAKTWIQASRDEEGVFWDWPETMPIWF
jgi:hypothetical protein